MLADQEFAKRTAMSRIAFAARILKPLEPASVLDIGCRDAELGKHLPGVDYNGADLFPAPGVKYVGDITKIEFDRTFDTVVACDILEHLDGLSPTFDRLMGIADKHLLISLPNTYDLKARINFATKGRINGKYLFTEEPPLDRHHWLMGRDEIVAFCNAKASKHGVTVRLFEMSYGSEGSRKLAGMIGGMLTRMLPRSLTTATVFALFSKQ